MEDIANYEIQIRDILNDPFKTGFEKCHIIYRKIEQSERPAEALKFFLGFEQDNETGNSELEQLFEQKDFQKLQRSCVGLANGILEKLVSSNCGKEEFYETLWKEIHEGILFTNDEERQFVLFFCWNDVRLPYFQLNQGVYMENEEYQELVGKLSEEIKKCKFIINSRLEQRTEQGSLLLKVLQELESEREKAVVFSQIIGYIEQRTTQSVLSHYMPPNQ